MGEKHPCVILRIPLRDWRKILNFVTDHAGLDELDISFLRNYEVLGQGTVLIEDEEIEYPDPT
jgi:hypothetical protein